MEGVQVGGLRRALAAQRDAAVTELVALRRQAHVHLYSKVRQWEDSASRAEPQTMQRPACDKRLTCTIASLIMSSSCQQGRLEF